MIPRLDAQLIRSGDLATLAALGEAARGVGFATVYNTALTPSRVEDVIEMYRAFFHLPESAKREIDMARTGANRGWGAPGSEQVDPDANPDYKQFFDSGFELSKGDPLAELSVYAPNQWPKVPAGFREMVQAYYDDARDVAMDVLRGIAAATDMPRDYFDAAFAKPMVLLRGNYYPERPVWATAKDFGIATHTDYGCLTLLATDGSPGLEVRKRGGGWIAVEAPPGEFVINFGEMMEFWTAGDVKATPHRVVGGMHERISVPLFFNPTHDTNVAPPGSDQVISAGDHLAKRFEETYVHLQKQ
ncbi:2-oxoglutarate and iron-dependent oxygenase domain-containing protein [Ascidiaceihabitans sp.]|uniref:isopenicillin N synthase family dioxygenase n=1 Tax=Ascidiaceihabitans sp. TaxID=1872644 RepID=UPI003296A527